VLQQHTDNLLVDNMHLSYLWNDPILQFTDTRT